MESFLPILFLTGGEEFDVIDRAMWREGVLNRKSGENGRLYLFAKDVLKGKEPVSFHLPIHRLFGFFLYTIPMDFSLRECFSLFWEKLPSSSLPAAQACARNSPLDRTAVTFLLAVVDQPLRLVATSAQIDAGYWRKDGMT